ncbi:Cytochrome c1 precursor [Candidatus Hodgkinia cicadicola]|nr:Cytochrome c1 precursor [Candidatus Hodgkinia cicadicola]
MLLAKQGLGLNAASASRGFEVHRQTCSRRHSLELFKLGDLRQLGYSRAQILCLANGGRISKRFELPYLSKAQAGAFNKGAVPPDSSLVVKRKDSNYIKRALFGYSRVRNSALARHYFCNYSFDSGVTLMPPILVDGVANMLLERALAWFGMFWTFRSS